MQHCLPRYLSSSFVGLVFSSFSLVAPALAQGNGPGVRGARAAALGNASVALAGEVWCVGNNVAGLGDLMRPAVGFYAENRYFSPALNVAALAVALPLGRPAAAPVTAWWPSRPSASAGCSTTKPAWAPATATASAKSAWAGA